MHNSLNIALTPTDEPLVFITDEEGIPQLAFNSQLDHFIRVLPLGADLKTLSKSHSWEIREAVAYHRNVTVDILTELARDYVLEVRAAARKHPACPKVRFSPKKA